MLQQTYRLELITPCFCGGAEPDKRAEIRAPSIRGQLRWWFRVLGGFKALAAQGMDLRKQENLIFGATSGGSGTAGRLAVRVSGLMPSEAVIDDEGMNAKPGTDRGYLLFPLRPKKKGKPGEHRRNRAVFNREAKTDDPPSFRMDFLAGERRDRRRVDRACDNLFACWSLGIPIPTSYGCARRLKSPMSLKEALARFSRPGDISVCCFQCSSPSDAITELARWLKSWRAHGRSGQNQQERRSPGFEYAKSDHDADKHSKAGFRAAIGLPLLAKYGDWNWSWNERKRKGEGRFASPVILRPHCTCEGKWYALVIFVGSLKWPNGKKVFFGAKGEPRSVSLDLYNAMKADKRLRPFV